MNKKEIRKLTRKLSGKLIIQLIIAEIGYLILLWGGLLGGMLIVTNYVWQPDDPIYQMLKFFGDNLFIFMPGLTIAGVVLILIYYWKKPMNYVEQLIQASQTLVDNRPDTQIALPDDLAVVEQQMNKMKTEVLRNERAAKEAEQRKNDLIVYLAHDLKTPLTSVIGYLSLLEDEKQISEEFRQRYLGIARNKAERLEELINEFFEITRFNLTTLTLEKETVDLSRMLEQMIWEFKPMALAKNLHFDLQILPKMEAYLDVGKMERVFDNLIRNAINYSYENSTIHIETTYQNSVIHIIVENEGRTIPEEKLSRIFEQFYRLDSSRSSQSGGSGVGLAIAKEIVELHQGKIKAESEQEKIRIIIEIPQNL